MRSRAIVVGACSVAFLGAASARPGCQAQPDIVVNLGRPAATIDVPLGRTLSIARPSPAERWTVDYAHEVLVMVTPDEKAEAPGPKGWRFHAAAVGETDIAFTEAVSGGGGGGAPPAPPRFVVTIKVLAK